MGPKKDVKMKPLSSLHLYHTFGIEPEAEKDDFSSYKLNLSNVTALVKSFRDDLYVIVNRRRQLLISLDGIYYRICGPFKNEYRGHVTAVHFYGNVFVMGFYVLGLDHVVLIDLELAEDVVNLGLG